MPCVLSDGSLLVHRVNASAQYPALSRWPEASPENPSATRARVRHFFQHRYARCLPDGKAVVFFGYPLDARGNKGPRGIYTLDPETGKTVNVAPGQVFSRATLGATWR